jgi:hypothetical protein
METLTHRTLILWGFDCADRFLTIFKDFYPDDNRPQIAVEVASKWSKGEIKMPTARSAILSCHQAANESNDNLVAQAAARAVGHAASIVHVQTHAFGLVIYGLTALIYQNKLKTQQETTSKELLWFHDKLLYWKENASKVSMTLPWASFIKS